MEAEGFLHKDAAKVILNVLYGARLVRYKLLWPICTREETRWPRACDKRLHRRMCYIHRTPDHSLESFVGDRMGHCHPVLFSDADYAGDIFTAKSTSGFYWAIVGPNKFASIAASCKKQTCVSRFSAESGIVAAEQGVRTQGLAALAFWELATELLRTDRPDEKVETLCATPNAIEMNP